jgi:hypothetical protein
MAGGEDRVDFYRIRLNNWTAFLRSLLHTMTQKERFFRCGW